MSVKLLFDSASICHFFIHFFRHTGEWRRWMSVSLQGHFFVLLQIKKSSSESMPSYSFPTAGNFRTACLVPRYTRKGSKFLISPNLLRQIKQIFNDLVIAHWPQTWSKTGARDHPSRTSQKGVLSKRRHHRKFCDVWKSSICSLPLRSGVPSRQMMVTLSICSWCSCGSTWLSTMEETLSTRWYWPDLSKRRRCRRFFHFSLQKQKTKQEVKVVKEPKVNMVAPKIHA